MNEKDVIGIGYARPEKLPLICIVPPIMMMSIFITFCLFPLWMHILCLVKSRVLSVEEMAIDD